LDICREREVKESMVLWLSSRWALSEAGAELRKGKEEDAALSSVIAENELDLSSSLYAYESLPPSLPAAIDPEKKNAASSEGSELENVPVPRKSSCASCRSIFSTKTGSLFPTFAVECEVNAISNTAMHK
jgi:hypothetical protein